MLWKDFNSFRNWYLFCYLFIYIYFVLCDRPGESSSEKNCCWWLTFRQPERKSSSGSSAQVVETSARSATTVLFRTTLTRTITQYELLILLGSNHLLCYFKMLFIYILAFTSITLTVIHYWKTSFNGVTSVIMLLASAIYLYTLYTETAHYNSPTRPFHLGLT